jgi:hypothetical protein
MKKTTRILHLCVALSLVLLPMRGVMADFSVMSASAELQTANFHGDARNHDSSAQMSHEMLAPIHPQMDDQSTDCHDHNMSDCEACALHFTLKNDIGISWLSSTPTLYTDYSASIVAPFLPSEIRPPIL